MSDPEFFSADGIGLALFLNAGDPPLEALPEVVAALDDAGVDCLELAVPFPDSVTDGPVVRRSAGRALDRGVGLTQTLDAVAALPARRLRIALLCDWAHSLRGQALPAALGDVAAAGADALLAHALPPRLRDPYRAAAADAGLPIVTTCYPTSPPAVHVDAATHATAYLYLVAHYGRSGTAPAAGHAALAGLVTRLRATAPRPVPIAVGFGVRTRDDVRAVAESGADAAVVGSAAVSRVEHALTSGHDVVAELHDFALSLHVTPARS